MFTSPFLSAKLLQHRHSAPCLLDSIVICHSFQRCVHCPRFWTIFSQERLLAESNHHPLPPHAFLGTFPNQTLATPMVAVSSPMVTHALWLSTALNSLRAPVICCVLPLFKLLTTLTIWCSIRQRDDVIVHRVANLQGGQSVGLPPIVRLTT